MALETLRQRFDELVRLARACAPAPATPDPLAAALPSELLTVVLKALTPRELARLEIVGTHYADRPGAVRRAVGVRLAARLGRKVGARRMARQGLAHRLDLAERIGVGSRLSGGGGHLLLLDSAGRVSVCGLEPPSGSRGRANESSELRELRPVAALAAVVVVQVCQRESGVRASRPSHD